MSILVDFHSPTMQRMMEIYLSKTSIGVSGKIRLATRAKIFTLTGLERDSGDSWKDRTMKAKKAKKTAKKKAAKKKKK